jgi:hypothetical protein
MKTPTIAAYLKSTCGWSQGIRAIFEKYQLAYEDRDIVGDAFRHREGYSIAASTSSSDRVAKLVP